MRTHTRTHCLSVSLSVSPLLSHTRRARTHARTHARSGELLNAETDTTDVFALHVPRSVTGVPRELLDPASQWPDAAEFASTLSQLGELYTVRVRACVCVCVCVCVRA